MSGKRPPGPVHRPGWDDDNDNAQGDNMPTDTTELARRWAYLREGASLAGMLAAVARMGSMDDLAAALAALDADQLEAATFAMVLLHVEGAPIDEPGGGPEDA